MKFGFLPTNWTFDPASAFLTLIIAPIFLYALLVVRRSLLAGTKYIVLGVTYRASLFLTKKAAASLTLRSYCRIQLNGDSKYLNVPGLRDVNLEIDEIFVPLTLEKTGEQKIHDHNQVLDLGNRIRVIGDPGSGKSSVAKRLFRDECEKGVARIASARFPILIELRKLRIKAHKLLNTQAIGYMVRS